jgi:hypothetical protein
LFDSDTRPAGILAIAAVEFLLAFAGLVFFGLTLAGSLPLASGRYLVGPGMETLGPFVFLVFSCVMLVTALGLLKFQNWARHITIVFAGLGIYFSIPTVSAAVISGELLATIREGLQIIARMVAIWYLLQQPTRDRFIVP